MPNTTPVTPARVAIVDPQTGFVSRPWYMFFQSLYQNITEYIGPTGNAIFGAVRATATFPAVETGASLEYADPGVTSLTSAASDLVSYGEIQFVMTNSDGTLVRYAGFDSAGNFFVPGQASGGFLPNGINTADQQLSLYTVVQNTISANVTMTTDVATLGSRADIIIVTSGVTSRTVTFGTGFKTTGTLATGTVAGKYFVISFVSNGSFMIETSRTVAM
jgi:hypothetical protein